ncbi:MAG: putative sugar O-methyltransferase [Ekhidna sp.]
MKFKELEILMEDLKKQNVLYRPSSFWHEASENIKSSLELNGIENFRSIQEALYFFVPTYGSPGNSFSKELSQELIDYLSKNYSENIKANLSVNQFLNGYMSAHADYRVLCASNDPNVKPNLSRFSESQFGNPVEQFEFDGKLFSRSSLNYLLGLSFLKRNLEGEFPKCTLEVGGGFGTLGEIITKTVEDSKYINIDIPPTIFIAHQYLKSIFGNDDIFSYEETRNHEEIEIDLLPKISCLPSWQIERLTGKVDLFVNFISFQEMEPKIVNNYINQIKRLEAKWVLLRNMKEGKQKKTEENKIGVVNPILSEDYLSMFEGYQLVDRNILPFGFKTVDNFHSELLLLKLEQ